MTLLLPAPNLYVSTTADYLDRWNMEKTGKRYRMNERMCPVGSYVSMMGLAASTCGRITSVDKIENRATVDWFIFDAVHWQKYPISGYCRWTDLTAAYPRMIERAAPRRF